MNTKSLVSKETVVLGRWESEKRKFGIKRVDKRQISIGNHMSSSAI